MGKNTKIGLAILLFLCLADMPYGYFQLVRVASLVGFSLLALDAKNRNKEEEMIIYTGLAILFQPIIKIPLGKSLWNVVDVIVGCYLLLSIKNSKKTN